ncbi:hypothetical protein LR48_Vigan10g063700 [Vigna angularis]|uniref:Uncharacterized protein n=1 Tax=Phaseolus angularis TaxID=3914 RepID=A0A0L9VI50_PHAAN|nr:hypothetical protein LR48_Vigan10g063700 [Vigna angularis]
MPTRRRTSGASSSLPLASKPATLEGWISDSEKQMEEFFANLSRKIEEMSLAHQTKLEELMKMHQTHHDYMCERFEDFDTRLGNIEDRFNLQSLDQPLSPNF